MRFFILLLLLALGIAGCKQMPDVPTVVSPYRIDIQQGNVVTQDMVDKLKPGMSRAQVRFALGSPLIVDPFRTDRWDYVYMFQRQGKETERRKLTVIFDDDKLVRVEGDVTSSDPASRPATKSAEKPVEKPAPKQAAKAEAPKSVESPKAKPEEAKDKPKEERGFFGRMLDKIGL